MTTPDQKNEAKSMNETVLILDDDISLLERLADCLETADHVLKKPCDPGDLIPLLRSKLQRTKVLNSVIKMKTNIYGSRTSMSSIPSYTQPHSELHDGVSRAKVDPSETDDIACVMQASLSRLVKLFEELTLFGVAW
jgi:hypothetical protein